MEVDIKGDKRGLGIEKRRKKSFFAQEAVALLWRSSPTTCLSYFKRWLVGGTELQEAGGGAACEGGLGDAGSSEDGKEGEHPLVEGGASSIRAEMLTSRLEQATC